MITIADANEIIEKLESAKSSIKDARKVLKFATSNMYKDTHANELMNMNDLLSEIHEMTL